MTTSPQDSLSNLQKKFKWPETRPDCTPLEWNLDGGGKSLVEEQIRKQQAKTLIEIGVFMGGSLKRWLQCSPTLTCVAIDPWKDGDWWATYAIANGKEDYAEQLGGKDGPYHTFLSTMWEKRDRIIPIKLTSEEALPLLFKSGVQPDILYIDSDKSLEELEMIAEVFPEATLTGDDWNWGMDQGFPVRKSLKRFAEHQGLHIRTRYTTWMATRQPPTLQERVTDLICAIPANLQMIRKRFKRWKESLSI
jgi:hypothetical protein